MRFHRKNNTCYSSGMIKCRLSSILHRITLLLGFLIAVYYLFMCVFSIRGALNDMRKFEGLGFSYSFWSYLCNNRFIDNIWKFALITFEYVLYTVLYHRISRKQYIQISVAYFVVMLVYHLILLLSVNYSVLPIIPPYIAENGFSLSDGIFLGIAAIQAVMYAVTFCLTVHCSGTWKE